MGSLERAETGEKFVLENCPFCGGGGAFVTRKFNNAAMKARGLRGRDTFHGIQCLDCQFNTLGLIGFLTPEAAACHWNKRKLAS